jgi:hypothetical protein
VDNVKKHLVQSMDIMKKNHLVQICGHREEAPCEIIVQSKDIMKKNHLVQSVNIMKNPSPVCQVLYL